MIITSTNTAATIMMRNSQHLVATSRRSIWKGKYIRPSSSLVPPWLQQPRREGLHRPKISLWPLHHTMNNLHGDNNNNNNNNNNNSRQNSGITMPYHRRLFTTTNNYAFYEIAENNDMKPTTRKLADALTGSSTILATSPSPFLSEEKQKIAEIRQRRFALAKAITLVESTAPTHRHQADLLLTHILTESVLQNNSSASTVTTDNKDENQSPKSFSPPSPSSFRLGIAGPPGAGKSTFIETFGLYILNDLARTTNNSSSSTNHNTNDDNDDEDDPSPFVPHKMAVVCIDPSSTVTGGSILGDKTRMTELSKHERAYVRPSANGGTFGGLSAYTHDVVSLCQAADYELVIVESVGLGQSEVEIAESVDMLVLIVPPGGGDELQGVKKGIVEVADLLLVNKADGKFQQAARSTAIDYRGAIHYKRQLSGAWPTTPILLTSAHTGEGIAEVWEQICKYRYLMSKSGELEEKRRSQARYWMWKNLKDLIIAKSHNDPVLRPKADAMVAALDSGAITPRVAAKEVLDFITTNGVYLH